MNCSHFKMVDKMSPVRMDVCWSLTNSSASFIKPVNLPPWFDVLSDQLHLLVSGPLLSLPPLPSLLTLPPHTPPPPSHPSTPHPHPPIPPPCPRSILPARGILWIMFEQMSSACSDYPRKFVWPAWNSPPGCWELVARRIHTDCTKANTSRKCSSSLLTTPMKHSFLNGVIKGLKYIHLNSNFKLYHICQTSEHFSQYRAQRSLS